MLLETMALAGSALALGFFARPVQGSFSSIWRPRATVATREPPKQVQAYEFCAGPTACDRSRRMNGHRFTVEGGQKLMPIRCGSIDCGCHYRRIDQVAATSQSLRQQRSGFR